MPDDDIAGKVTQRQLFEEVARSAREQREATQDLADRMDAGFALLRHEMQKTYAVSAVCEQKHQASDDALHAAVDASQADRDRIWQELRNLRQEGSDDLAAVELAAKDAAQVATKAATNAAAVAQDALGRVLLIAGGLAVIPTAIAALAVWFAATH